MTKAAKFKPISKKRDEAEEWLCRVKMIGSVALGKGLQQIRETNGWLTEMWKLPVQQFMTCFLPKPRNYIYLEFILTATLCWGDRLVG